MYKSKKLIGILALITIVASGCVSAGPSKNEDKEDTSAVDGGVWVSKDKGNTWEQKSLIPTLEGEPRKFVSVSASAMALDPNDHEALYFAGADKNGMLYSYDSSENWTIAESLGKRTVNTIAIDPFDKCNIYVGIGNKLIKSTDCNRTWQEEPPAYHDNELKANVAGIALDNYNEGIVIIAINSKKGGNILRSVNGGKSWDSVKTTDEDLIEIAFDPRDTRIVYAATEKKYIYRSDDGGRNWVRVEKLYETLKELKLDTKIKDIAFSQNASSTEPETSPSTLFVATYYGLLKSNNKGVNWEDTDLLKTEKDATINSIEINPNNNQELYYVTNTTFYRSEDGGHNWTTIQLPTTRAGFRIVLDPEDENLVYMGVKKDK